MLAARPRPSVRVFVYVPVIYRDGIVRGRREDGDGSGARVPSSVTVAGDALDPVGAGERGDRGGVGAADRPLSRPAFVVLG